MVERIFWHEVVQIQLPDTDIGIIAHQVDDHIALGIPGDGGFGFGLYDAFSFMGGKICSVFVSIYFHCAIEGDALWDAVSLHH